MSQQKHAHFAPELIWMQSPLRELAPSLPQREAFSEGRDEPGHRSDEGCRLVTVVSWVWQPQAERLTKTNITNCLSLTVGANSVFMFILELKDYISPSFGSTFFKQMSVFICLAVSYSLCFYLAKTYKDCTECVVSLQRQIMNGLLLRPMDLQCSEGWDGINRKVLDARLNSK